MAIRIITPILIVRALLVSGPLWSQQYSGNIFDESGDIGRCAIKGSTEFVAERQEYLLTGSGDNIWFGEDQFHFAWKKLKGDFILRADVRFIGEGSHAHRKAGWMIRRSLDTGSPHVSGTVHDDGLDDGSEYSPDGRYIYFNSVRTGTMQLWRMKPDGSEVRCMNV